MRDFLDRTLQGPLAFVDPRYWPVTDRAPIWTGPVPGVAGPSLGPAAANATAPAHSLFGRLMGGLDCVQPDGSLVVVSPNTRFLSHCFLSAFGLVWALLFAKPLLDRLRKLRHLDVGNHTTRGQLAALAGLSTPELVIIHSLLAKGGAPVLADLGIVMAQFLVTAVQWLQDGHVAVSPPEVLLFTLGQAAVYTGWAIDAAIREPWRQAVVLAAAAVLATASFVLELWNPERHPQNRFADFSVFSKISINFAVPVLEKSRKEQISHEDLPLPPADMDAQACGEQFEAALRARMDSASGARFHAGARAGASADHPHTNAGSDPAKSDGRYKVFLSVLSVAGGNILFSAVMALLSMVTQLAMPVLVMTFLRSLAQFQAGEAPLYRCYYIAMLFGLVPLTSAALDSLERIQVSFAESKTRAAILSTLYRKALNLSPGARENYDSSKIMNLMSVDSGQVFSMVENLASLVSTPLLLVLSTWQLWKLLGYSFFGALAVYIFLIPAQTVLSTRIGEVFPKLMQYVDQRNKLTSNVFRSIKSLKLYAWEKPFTKRVEEVRAQELSVYRTVTTISVLLTTSFNSTSDFVAVAIFICFLYLKQGVLSADVVFPSLLLLQYVSGALIMLPLLIVSWQQGLTSCGRIYALLAQPADTRENYERLPQGASGFDEPAIVVKDAKVSWNGDDTDEKVVLRNVSFEAMRGDLVCIVGRVGAGKTAMLRNLCGDLSVLEGSVTLKGSVAYSAQEPWLQNLTLRENVLFGQVMDQEWYDKVIEACELTHDIAGMPNGHETNVGERGISLSGGQKARVALARAVYSRSDIILLDDVLSAVDEHVSAALIKKLFGIDGLLANRTVVLSTNNIKVLSHSSRIVALADKQIVEISSFSDVLKKGEESLIYGLIEEFGHADDLKKSHEEVHDRRAVAKERYFRDTRVYEPTTSERPAEFTKFDVYASSSDEEEDQVVSSLKPFIRYYFLDRPWFTWLSMALLLVSIVFRNSVIAYIGVIASHNFTDLYDARWYFALYIGIATGVAVFLAINMFSIEVVMALRNSQILHNRMLWATVRAPMSFFDKTPLGRLINRFTSDLSALDNGFASVGSSVLRAFLNVVVTMIPILFGAPQLLIIVIPLGWYANRSRVLYVPAQRKVTRIFSAANSPILSHVEDSIKGQAIVRSFGQVGRFEDIFVDRVNYWVKASFFAVTLSRWLSFRITMISVILGFGAALGMTQLIGLGLIGVSYAGVILNFCERTGIMVGQTIQSLASAQTRGVSLERVLEYVDMKQEAPDRIEATQPSGTWPRKGEITFDNLTVRYSEDGPDVLKGLSLKVNSGEKIGVVGRTGSGKSTLTLAIFRIIEAAKGRMEIDKIDTSILGLADLRSRLSIVPQDSQIFDSSVRDNLDPLHTVDDARLWEVLELCHLKSHFQKYDGLDTELTDSGSQLSRGQAQLLCLGRALVHESKVLVLDEATASVDHETDKIIQETIRTNLSDRTIITVAHRLNTIMDSDRVLVLDKGEIKEFDTPQRLLEAKGIFYSLHNTEQKEEHAEADQS